MFTIKDIGDITYMLGIEIASSSFSLFLCQRIYTLDILHDCGYLAAKPINSPMDNRVKFSSTAGTPLTDPKMCRRLIGRLLLLEISV